jgi:hypothetical protein
MLEVGAFHPAWGDIHLGPDNALKALAMLGNAPFLPVHWGTFNLAMHAWDEPAEALVARAPSQGARLVMPKLGEPIEPSHAGDVDAWWRPLAAIERAGAEQGAEHEEEEPPSLPPHTEEVPFPMD